jgi:hypothetical protein
VLDAVRWLVEGPRRESGEWEVDMRRLALSACLFLAAAGLAACGSSEPEPAAPPAAQPAAKAAPPEAPAAPAAPVTQGQKQEQLLSLMVWPDPATPEPDKRAAAQACQEQIAADPASQGAHALVVIAKWVQCMEARGWKQKAQG